MANKQLIIFVGIFRPIYFNRRPQPADPLDLLFFTTDTCHFMIAILLEPNSVIVAIFCQSETQTPPPTPICANGNDLQPQHTDNNLFDFSGFAKNIPNTQQVRVVATITEPAIFANIFIKKMIVSETIFIEFPRIFTTFHPRKGIE